MVLFFTGTGNSKYIADAIADKLSDEVVSLNDIIKNGKELTFVSEKPFVVVAPIYAWRYPNVVEEALKKATFTGAKEIYFLATMGSETGRCDKYCAQIAAGLGLKFMGFCGIPMPNNYVIYSVMDDEETTDGIVMKARPEIARIAAAIAAGEEIRKTDKTFMAGFLSGAVNSMFTKFMCSSKNYVVSDACISCGLCAQKCPLNNVTIEPGEHPKFGGSCINCYACIQYCPKQAIDIKGKTENHGRYTCKPYVAE